MHILIHRPDDMKRWLDAEGRSISVVEVTIRTNHGRMALTPTKRNNELIVGVLGKAQEKYDFEIYAIAVMGNHIHYLIGVRTAELEALIKCFLHSNIAREIHRYGHFVRGRRVRTRGRMWGRRGRAIPVLDDESLEARLRYILANGTKEGLVSHPTRMPGVHAARPLCDGSRELRGVWYDRTKLTALRRKRGKAVAEREAATEYTVKLSKLPTLRHLSDESYADYCRAMCDDIAAESRARLVAEHGKQFRPVGAKKLLKVDPFTFPDEVAESPAPLVHCADKETRETYREAYYAFVEAYQEAHLHLRNAIRSGKKTRIEFPPGGIPPAGLLVG